MENKKEGLSRRQARREEIRRKERRQRMTVLGVIGAIVLLILVAIVAPTLLGDNSTTTGLGDADNFTPVAPGTYTQAEGARLGDPNAPVKIEVFEDFQCPACKTYTENVEPDVIANLVDTGQAYYIFYQYPFLDDNSASKDSDRAAMAAYCAADQNRFWDYKKLLYTNSQEISGVFSEARLKAFAESLQLDMTAFEACYDDGKFQSEIENDLALGKQMGVTGTPSVFVNGKDVSPGQVPSYSQILAAVQAATGE